MDEFYGMLFGAEHEADSIFTDIERNYNELKTIAHKSNTRMSIIIDKVTGPVWYVPGGQSTLGQVIADATQHILSPTTVTAAACLWPLKQCWQKQRTPTYGCYATTAGNLPHTHLCKRRTKATRSSKHSGNTAYTDATLLAAVRFTKIPPSVPTCC